MRVHHLNCGTMTPRLGGPLVAHVLLLETPHGLVLVDTGFGLDDIAAPAARLGPARHLLRPRLDPEETAVRQVERLGFARSEVAHVILTQIGPAHCGGLGDFPGARVHVAAPELAAALAPETGHERRRCRSLTRSRPGLLLEHHPQPDARWRGFERVTVLRDVAEGIVLVTLPGHTRGGAMVAVDAGDHWVLHAGGVFLDPAGITGDGVRRSLTRRVERHLAHDPAALRANHDRLRSWTGAEGADVLLVNSHDPGLLARAQGRGTTTAGPGTRRAPAA